MINLMMLVSSHVIVTEGDLNRIEHYLKKTLPLDGNFRFLIIIDIAVYVIQGFC